MIRGLSAVVMCVVLGCTPKSGDSGGDSGVDGDGGSSDGGGDGGSDGGSDGGGDGGGDGGSDGGGDGGGGGEGLESGFEAALAGPAGCGDVFMYSAVVDDSLGLRFQVSGLAEAAHAAGGAQTSTYTLPDDLVDLRVELGEHISHSWCNDAMEFETTVTGTWVAAGGSAVITVTPSGEPTDWGEFPAQAQLVLTDVVFVSGDESVTLPTLTLDAYVGWMPG